MAVYHFVRIFVIVGAKGVAGWSELPYEIVNA